MRRTLACCLLLAIASPATEAAASRIEFEGSAARSSRSAFGTAAGFGLAWVESLGEGLEWGVRGNVDRFPRRSDSSTALTSTAFVLQLRMPLVTGRRARCFASAGTGLYTWTQTFSTEARRRNDLLPRQDMSLSGGVSVGTGVVWTPVGQLEILSQQRYDVSSAAGLGTQALTVSAGIGLRL